MDRVPNLAVSPIGATAGQVSLLRNYQNMRRYIGNFETLLHVGNGFSERDLKEIDKAIVLLKTGCKLIKRRLRKAGFQGKLKVASLDGRVSTSLDAARDERDLVG